MKQLLWLRFAEILWQMLQLTQVEASGILEDARDALMQQLSDLRSEAALSSAGVDGSGKRDDSRGNGCLLVDIAAQK